MDTYLLAVYENFEVRKLSQEDAIPNSEIKLIIKGEFYRNSSSGKHTLYDHTLYDHANNLIENNTFSWNGITCQIGLKENWEVVKAPSHHGVALSATITDKLNELSYLKFENNSHDGSAFQELFNYIKQLLEYSTHKSTFAIIGKDQQIESLKAIIKDSKIS